MIKAIIAIAPLPPKRTGIAEYSREFYMNLSKNIGVILFTNKTNIKVPSESKIILTTYKHFPNPKMIIDVIKEAKKTKTVHIQVGLRSIGNHVETILYTVILAITLKIMGSRFLVTLHTIPTKKAIGSLFGKSLKNKIITEIFLLAYRVFLHIIFRKADLIHVHQKAIRLYIEKNFKVEKSKIIVLPHGTRCNKGDKNNNSVDVGDGEYILFHGFIRKSKGLEKLIEAFIELERDYPALKLIVAGPLHENDEKYINSIVEKIRSKGLIRDKIKLEIRYLDQRDIEKFARSSKVIVLPYTDFFLEASGVLAKMICYGKPLLCSKIPKFYLEEELRPYITYFEPGNKESLVEKMKYILNNYEREFKKAEKLKKIAEDRTWEKLVKDFLKKLK